MNLNVIMNEFIQEDLNGNFMIAKFWSDCCF